MPGGGGEGGRSVLNIPNIIGQNREAQETFCSGTFYLQSQTVNNNEAQWSAVISDMYAVFTGPLPWFSASVVLLSCPPTTPSFK